MMKLKKHKQRQVLLLVTYYLNAGLQDGAFVIAEWKHDKFIRA